MNLTFLVFALLAFIPPLYTRYEHIHHRDDPIPTQLKWTAQVALGSSAVAHSVCKIAIRAYAVLGTGSPGSPGPLGATDIRDTTTTTTTRLSRAVLCASLGVAGGAVSTRVMMQEWDARDWEYFQRLGGEGKSVGRGRE